jgi:two-component system chemotaxis response regulator CheY
MDTPTAAAPRKGLVLLVDPDDHSRVLYGESLRLAAFDVEEATDGREALVRAAVSTPTVIVTETRLRFIDGYALCSLFRADPPTRDTPIIVLTADEFPAQLDRARDSGADSILVKPCPPEQLLAEIDRLPATWLQPRAAPAPGVAARHARSGDVLAFAEQKRRTHVKAHQRFETTTPPQPPPELWCPTCAALLKYERSHIGGVSDRHPEQWDYFSCAGGCGTFQYRQRTRRLRPAG